MKHTDEPVIDDPTLVVDPDPRTEEQRTEEQRAKEQRTEEQRAEEQRTEEQRAKATDAIKATKDN